MDPILYWNSVAREVNRRDFSNVAGTDKPSPEQGGPTLSSRAVAIVHLAMYDAHAGRRSKRALVRTGQCGDGRRRHPRVGPKIHP